MGKRFLVIGEINVDVIVSGLPCLPELGREVLCSGIETVMGSASAIFACRLATLGESVSFLGLVGDDENGRIALRSLEAAGVDTSLVTVDAALQTGVTYVLTFEEDRAMFTCLGAIAELSRRHIPRGLLARFDHLHVTSPYLQVGLRPHLRWLLKQAADEGLTVSFDPQWDPDQRWRGLRGLAPHVNLLFANDTEACAMARQPTIEGAMEKLIGIGSHVVAVKRGAKGAAAACGTERVDHKGFPVRAVDTTGAGDTFDAAFVKRYIGDGASLAESLAYACAAGALACKHIGGAAEPLSDSAVRAVLKRGRA